MAVATGAGQRATISEALAQRYGYSFEAAARPPPVTPPPPGNPPPRRTPVVNPPSGRVPSFLELPKPPYWVRAYQRLTWGITPNSIHEFNALGSNFQARYNALVEQQLAWETIDDSATENRLAAAGYTTLAKTLPQLWNDHIVNTADYNVRMRPAFEVQRATLVRAVHSRRQLYERVVNFWNDHFNVLVTDYDAGPLYVHYNRNVIRNNAFGNFRMMLEAMARSTSMMYYLDNRSNTRNGPNENFARELLELHTFGAENYLGFVDPNDVPPCPEDPTYPIGYTDIDVYETAAAFTGWTVNTGTGGDGTFLYRASNHDPGPKYILGRFLPPEQPAMKDGWDVMDRVCGHPRVAKFICKKLIRHFITDEPPQSLIDSAAAIFRQNSESSDQIRLTLRHILRSDAALEDWGNKRRRPSEVLAASMRTAGADWTLRVGHARSDDLIYRLSFTGHRPHEWAAPNGFPDVSNAWSGANNFAMTWKLLGWLTEASDDTLRLMSIVETSRALVPQWTARTLVDFWCNRILGYMPMPGRVQMLVNFMAQNGNADSYVIEDTDAWSGNDLKRHYNHQRLRNLVSMILMSPEFFNR